MVYSEEPVAGLGQPLATTKLIPRTARSLDHSMGPFSTVRIVRCATVRFTPVVDFEVGTRLMNVSWANCLLLDDEMVAPCC